MDIFDISVKRFDEFAAEYAERFENIDDYLVHFDKFCDLNKISKPRILELACGPGNVTRYLKQQFQDSEVIAIDLAPHMIDIAQESVIGVDFRVMDVRNINDLDVQFDSIMCSFCLPYLSKKDANKLISDCSYRLVDGGILYLSTMEGDESKAGLEDTSFSGDSKVYINYHKLEYLESCFINNGFQIEYNTQQEYHEANGEVSIDLILIGRKVSKS